MNQRGKQVQLTIMLLALICTFVSPRVLADTSSASGTRASTESIQAPANVDKFSGQFSTRVPIMIPPGRPDATPSLALVYSSAGGSGPFGFGWSLPLGSISRSAKHGVPTCAGDYTQNEFVLSLSGGESELVYVGSDTFRVKIDDAFVELHLDPTQNTWEAYDRSGMRYRFGWVTGAPSDPSARVFTGADVLMDTVGCAFTAQWGLTEISDTYGNTVEIQYQKDGNILYPATILYGGNATASPPIPHPFRVDFALVARSQEQRTNRLGVEQTLAWLVDEISVSWKATESDPGFSLLRTYFLEHTEAGAGAQALLTAVDSPGMPLREFEYSTGDLDFDPVAQSVPAMAGSDTLRLLSVNGIDGVNWSLLDMNGDGITDYVQPVIGSGTWNVTLRLRDGSTQAIVWDASQLPSADWMHLSNYITPGQPGYRFVYYDTIDITGDGIPDFVDSYVTPWTVYPGQCSTPTSCGFGPAISWASPTMGSELTWIPGGAGLSVTHNFLSDMDADGRLDLVTTSANLTVPWSIYKNTGAGFDLNARTINATGGIRLSSSDTVNSKRHNDLVDFNGDGLPDLLSTTFAQISETTHDYLLWGIYDANGTFLEVRPRDEVWCWVGLEKSYCPGVVPAGGGVGPVLQVQLNDGRAFGAPVYSPLPSPGSITASSYISPVNHTHQDLVDYNADGLPDLVAASGAAQGWRVSLNAGGGRLDSESIQLNPQNAQGLIVGVHSTHVVPWVDQGNLSQQIDWFPPNQIKQFLDFIDLDGDGIGEVVHSSPGTWGVYNRLSTDAAGVTRPYLMTRIHNGVGGETEIRYAPSTLFDNGGPDGLPDLAFPLWVTTGIRKSDGLCDPGIAIDTFDRAQNPCIDLGHELITTIDYEGGVYSRLDREFRGFARVTEYDVAGNRTETVFEQDEYRRGRLKSREVFAGSYLEPIESTQNTWEVQDSPGGEARKQVYLLETRTTKRNLNQTGSEPANEMCAMTRNQPPDEYGRVSWSCTLSCTAPGVPPLVDPSDACSVAPDGGQTEIVSTWTTPVAGSRVRDRVQSITTRDRHGDGTIKDLSIKSFFYDGAPGVPLPVGQVDKGSPTRVDSPVGPRHTGPGTVSVENRYDDTGNLFYTTTGAREEIVFDFGPFRLYPARKWESGINAYTFTYYDLRYGKLERVIDPNLNVTEMTFDFLGRAKCVAEPGDSLADCTREYFYQFGTGGEGVALETALSFVEVRRKEPSNPRGYVAGISYRDALGREVFTTREEVVLGDVGPLRTVVENHKVFDALGSVSALYPPYPLVSGPIPMDPPGQPTVYDYHLNGSSAIDPFGRPHVVDPPDATVLTKFYEGTDERAVDARGNWQLSRSDDLGRVIREEGHEVGGALLSQVDATYDGMGRVLTSTVGATSATTVTYLYDYLGRVVERFDPDSGLWKYGYDERGNVVYVDDPKTSQHTQACYDGADRVTLSCNYATSDAYDAQACASSCGAGGGTVEAQYTYDPAEPNGIGALGSVTDTSGSVDYDYDERGRVQSMSKTVQGRTATFGFEYDAGGHLWRLTYPDGEVLEYTFNEAGRVYSMFSADRTYLQQARYDEFGRHDYIGHGNGTFDYRSHYGADQGFRLSGILVDPAGPDPAVVNLGYTYNDLGKVETITDYRDTSGPLSNTATYEYDGLGRLSTVTETPGQAYDDAFGFDDVGNLALKAGKTFTHSSTKPHQITGFDGASFTYDGNGNMTSKGARASNPVVLGLEYDVRDRLSARELDGASRKEFRYDFAGNRVFELPSGGVPVRHFSKLAYSENGNLVKRYFAGDRLIAQRHFYAPEFSGVPVGGGPRPGWDMPAEVPIGLLLIAGFGLMGIGRGRRVIGVRLVRSRAAGGVVLAITILVPSVLLHPIPASAGCEDDPAYTRHFHLDHRGSTIAVTDADGNLVHQARYDSYGAVRGRFDGTGSPVALPFLGKREFTGYETDPGSELQYAGARYYDPELGSFLTHDPAGQFASPYTYGPGDPMNGVDPDGAFWIFAIALALAVANAIYVGVTTGDAGAGIVAFAFGLVGAVASAAIVTPLVNWAIDTVNNTVFTAAVYSSMLGTQGYQAVDSASKGNPIGVIGFAITLMSAAYSAGRSDEGGDANDVMSGTAKESRSGQSSQSGNLGDSEGGGRAVDYNNPVGADRIHELPIADRTAGSQHEAVTKFGEWVDGQPYGARARGEFVSKVSPLPDNGGWVFDNPRWFRGSRLSFGNSLTVGRGGFLVHSHPISSPIGSYSLTPSGLDLRTSVGRVDFVVQGRSYIAYTRGFNGQNYISRPVGF